MVTWSFLCAVEFKTLPNGFGATALNSADESAYGIPAFVERVYTFVLVRQPDVDGFGRWVTAVINGSYAGGRQGWLNVLAQGSSRTDVINGFIGSAEFAALARHAA